jgi:hypothetical protein
MPGTIRSMAVSSLAALLVATILSGAAPARVRTVIRESFPGTGAELPARWKDVDGDWRRAKGSARIVPRSVSARTNIAYSVRAMRSSYAKRGFEISTRLRLSPTHSNVGVVGPYRSAGNHLFCKIEKTPVHPEGFLAIGRRLHDKKPVILVKQDHLGISQGRRYTLELTRQRALVTCSLLRQGTTMGSVDYTMTRKDRRAFGAGRKVGIRMRLVARGTRRDEDDGRSLFDNFMVKTLS